MRVLIAPDDFKGTLSAVEAAEAIAAGWRSHAPDDTLTLIPMSDGGPGFVRAVSTVLGGDIAPVGLRGPMGETAIGMVLMVDGAGYVESAHGCGLALVHSDRRNARAATSYGVGQLIAAAIDSGARRIVVGLGGTASTDGGAGMLAALGATARDAAGVPVALDAGGAAPGHRGYPAACGRSSSATNLRVSALAPANPGPRTKRPGLAPVATPSRKTA